MKNKFRDNTLDTLKGIALLLMLLAHAENVFNNGHNSWIGTLNYIGTTFALTLFLFASGVGSGYQYFSEKKNNTILKSLKRFFYIYLAYGILNSIYIFLFANFDKSLLIDALLFKSPQIYTEFLIPLLFLPLFGLIISKLPSKIYKNIYVFSIIIILIYVVGACGANVNWDESIRSYMVLLFGSFRDYRYPIFQYAVVYLIGLRFGIYLLKDKSEETKINDIGSSSLLITLFLLLVAFTNPLMPSEFDFFRRWPPGIGFLLIGVCLAFTIYYICIALAKLKIWKNLQVIGKVTLIVFVIHIVMVYLYEYFFNYKFTNVILILLSIIAFIALNFSLGYFYYFTRKIKDLKNNMNLILAFLVVFLISSTVIVYGLYSEKINNTYITDNVVNNEKIIDIDKEPKLILKQSRVWILKGQGISDDLEKTTIRVSLDQKLISGRFVQIRLEGATRKVVVAAEKTNDYNYKAVFNADDLEPGEYTVTAFMEDRPTNVSNTLNIKVSYPLVVTWTLDYEGYDVSDANLKAISDFSEKFGMPLTHLFNPRIFIASEITKERSDYLVGWVMNRYTQKNDQIGLHLHMHCDMISAIGMKPKTQPNWGGRTNCHDVLTSAYNYNDFTRIIKWAKNQFNAHGLPVPLIYRAGGWFIGETQLKVLQDQGFVIDTSGRSTYVWGVNKQVGPWTLSATTHPYFPSEKEQNSSEPAPQLTIAEIPNNGMDSTNNDAQVLKAIFDENYQNKPLDKFQVLTYMSHPHWFTLYDKKRVDDLLTYIGKNKIIDDNGPVIYLTSQQAYDYWDKK